jgi:hypothetical protein
MNKKKTQPAASLPRLVRCKLRKELHNFVDEIVKHAECPSMWPLTQSEQIAFVRKVIYQARKIRNTEEYLAEAMRIAAEDVAMAS